jgi:hypothetical protein
MHIPDMQENDYAPNHFAVGWLHPDHPFPTGEISSEFTLRLKQFASAWGESIHALNWGAAGGVHICEFCGKAIAAGTFGVPAGDKIFHAPEMIAHYVERHSYVPPPEFIAAVMASPLPGTPEYAAAIARFKVHLE